MFYLKDYLWKFQSKFTYLDDQFSLQLSKVNVIVVYVLLLYLLLNEDQIKNIISYYPIIIPLLTLSKLWSRNWLDVQ